MTVPCGRGLRTRGLVLAASALLTLPLAGCGGDEETLTVLAAASLTETFTELAETFEEEHPGTDVRLVFGSSTTLAEQVVDGAPGDVLATADEDSMVTAGEAVVDPTVFATNRLTVVTPAGNPAGIESLDDLEREDVAYVVCVASAPCGRAVEDVLGDGLRRTNPPASEEIDVKAVLAKVASGEADAGFVYVTDAVAAGDSVEQPLPALGEPVLNRYPIGVTADASDPDLARQLVTLVLSEEGQRLLREAGFEGVARQ